MTERLEHSEAELVVAALREYVDKYRESPLPWVRMAAVDAEALADRLCFIYVLPPVPVAW